VPPGLGVARAPTEVEPLASEQGLVLGRPKRCKLAHALLWEYSYKRLKLAQLLGRHGVFLTCLTRMWSTARYRSLCMLSVYSSTAGSLRRRSYLVTVAITQGDDVPYPVPAQHVAMTTGDADCALSGAKGGGGIVPGQAPEQRGRRPAHHVGERHRGPAPAWGDHSWSAGNFHQN
jgi:hypothetical protein